jgi:hypothetical protein
MFIFSKDKGLCLSGVIDQPRPDDLKFESSSARATETNSSQLCIDCSSIYSPEIQNPETFLLTWITRITLYCPAAPGKPKTKSKNQFLTQRRGERGEKQSSSGCAG